MVFFALAPAQAEPITANELIGECIKLTETCKATVWSAVERMNWPPTALSVGGFTGGRIVCPPGENTPKPLLRYFYNTMPVRVLRYWSENDRSRLDGLTGEDAATIALAAAWPQCAGAGGT